MVGTVLVLVHAVLDVHENITTLGLVGSFDDVIVCFLGLKFLTPVDLNSSALGLLSVDWNGNGISRLRNRHLEGGENGFVLEWIDEE